jgi:hypothetical protein
LRATDYSSYFRFEFDLIISQPVPDAYEVAIAYLREVGLNQTLTANYSELKVYLSGLRSNSFTVTPSDIRNYLSTIGVNSASRSVMFWVRGYKGSSKPGWSNAIYLTPDQVNRGVSTGTTPTPTATPTPTPAPTPIPTPSLLVGRFFSGQDNDDTSWKWVAVEISNSSNTQILSHRSYDVLIGDAGGAIVDSSWEPSFPLLGPGQKAWYVATQFNSRPSSQVVFRKTYSTQPSPLTAQEFPTTSNARLATSPYYSTRKSVAFTIKNNSSSRILNSSSTAFAVVFDSSGNPIYAERGFIGKSVLPGGSAEVSVGDFTFNGSYSSIQVLIGVVLD